MPWWRTSGNPHTAGPRHLRRGLAEEGSVHATSLRAASPDSPGGGWVRGQLPWEFRGFTLGGDFEGFRRRSNFDFEEIGQVRQTARIWQVFLSYNPRQGRSHSQCNWE